MQSGFDSFPFDSAERIRPVPQRRISEKVDALMARQDYAGVERTLLYWLAEAKAGGDRRGELMIRGELVGHYRKTGERDKAHASAKEALRLVAETGLAGSVSEAAACVNIGTAHNAFGENAEALPLFERARAILEASPGAAPSILGGMYNNMGLTLAALGRFEEALACYEKALAQMEKVPGGEAERAITCLNMADAETGRLGAEAAEARVDALLGQAEALLDTPTLPRDGYYAYVCEHCAPTFAHYGWFLTEERLTREAGAIHERT